MMDSEKFESTLLKMESMIKEQQQEIARLISASDEENENSEKTNFAFSSNFLLFTFNIFLQFSP